MNKVLEGYLYAPTHEWAKVEGNTATFGITEFAQSQLGSVVFVDLPERGAKLIQGREFGAVESVKAASDLISPLSGTVLAVNEDLVGDPEGINRDAFASWLVKVELAKPAETAQLLSAEQYRLISK